MSAKEITEDVVRLVGILCFAGIWYALKAVKFAADKYYKLYDWIKAK